MYKILVYSSFLKLDACFKIPISLYVDKSIDETDLNYKIALVIEPFTIRSDYHNYILNNFEKFNYILTHDTEILKLPNAVLFEYGASWINHLDYNYKNKEFGVSFLISNKLISEGHFLRRDLWYKQDKIKINKIFFKSYRSSFNGFEQNPILYEDKKPLFDTMFSIVIENTKTDFYFTEKLTDCLIAKTIPIYWGANKISDYFENIIQVKDIDQIIDVCNNLKPEDYFNNLDTIENNFNRALKYENYNQRIIDKINKLIYE